MRKFVCLVLAISSLFCATAQQPFFEKNERVIFLGNSITLNGGFYHQLAIFYATRYPNHPVRFYNAGIGGDATRGVLARLEADVLQRRPTSVVLKLGMNDVNRSFYVPGSDTIQGIQEKRDKAIETYERGIEKILSQLLKNNIRVVLQTPTIYDQTSQIPSENFKGRNDALQRCSEFIKKISQKYSLPLVDYRSIMMQVNAELQGDDPTATIVGADRVHPGPAGHWLMAYQFLKTTGALNNIPQVIISGKKINTKSNLYRVKDTLQFVLSEQSLPMPLDTAIHLPAALAKYQQEMNRSILTIKDISPGQYRILIDGEEAGNFDHHAFRKGINVFALNSHQYKQSMQVLELYKKYKVIELRLRGLVRIELQLIAQLENKTDMKAAETYFRTLIKEQDTTSSKYKDLDYSMNFYLAQKPLQQQMLQDMDSLWQQVYTINQPLPHTYRIEKIIPVSSTRSTRSNPQNLSPRKNHIATAAVQRSLPGGVQ